LALSTYHASKVSPIDKAKCIHCIRWMSRCAPEISWL